MISKKHFYKKSYAGAYQITAIEKSSVIEDDPVDTMCREAYEKLSLNILKDFFAKNPNTSQLFNDENTVIYGKNVFFEFLDLIRKIRLHSSTGGLLIIRLEDLKNIKELNDEDKKGVFNDIIKMSSEEIQALKKGFEIFSN